MPRADVAGRGSEDRGEGPYVPGRQGGAGGARGSPEISARSFRKKIYRGRVGGEGEGCAGSRERYETSACGQRDGRGTTACGTKYEQRRFALGASDEPDPGPYNR